MVCFTIHCVLILVGTYLRRWTFSIAYVLVMKWNNGELLKTAAFYFLKRCSFLCYNKRVPIILKLLELRGVLPQSVEGAGFWSLYLLICYYCLQSQEEAYESNKEDDAEGLVGPWEGWPLFLIYGKHKYSVLLLCRHPQDTRKHLWHVCATGQGFPYYLERAVLTLLPLID